jgi:hypothetical protein
MINHSMNKGVKQTQMKAPTSAQKKYHIIPHAVNSKGFQLTGWWFQPL